MARTTNLARKAAELRAVTPAPRPPAEQIEDSGTILERFERSTPEPHGSELRVTWSTFNGHPYVGVRLWLRDARGLLWPSKSEGITVRLGELPGFIDAIDAAAEMALGYQQERARER